jgi:hypothetical protein
MNRLAREIGAVLDCPVMIRHDAARPGDIRHSIGNPGLAACELAFAPIPYWQRVYGR